MSEHRLEEARPDEEPQMDRPENVALAIKRCLDSLASDARQSRMLDLAHFIGLAALAAEDAARAHAACDPRRDLMDREPLGSC